MSPAPEVETDFAAVMQELCAQSADASYAKKEVPAASPIDAGISELIGAVHSLGQRLEALEESVLRNFEELQFQKLEEHLAAIRDSETVNQQLFDSLHKELISYRDNFVRESLQKPFIRDLLILFDDLNAIAGQVEESAAADEGQSEDTRLRDNISNTLHFLLEILHRLEVNEIELKATVDRTLHRVITFEPTDCAEEDGHIVRRVKRGFTWHDRVLRPEEVVVKRFR
jgi:molecular chaperone GrpE (heat shock protein)